MTLTWILISSLHLLAALIWVGGMFFAYRILRPSASQLEAPQRLSLWKTVFSRFFGWVWVSILVLLVTGYADVLFRFGGFEHAGWAIRIMHGLGWVMILLFAFLYLRPYSQFKRAVDAKDWPVAGQLLNQRIRPIIGINLTLGLIVCILGASALYW